MSTIAPRPDPVQILADLRGDAAILRRNGQATLADRYEEIAARIAESIDEYTTWLDEATAATRAGWKAETVRRFARSFGESHHVRWTKGKGWELRACVVPRRAEPAIIAASAQRKAS